MQPVNTYNYWLMFVEFSDVDTSVIPDGEKNVICTEFTFQRRCALATSPKLLEWDSSEEVRSFTFRLIILVFHSSQQRHTQCIQFIKGEINLLLKARVQNKLENCSGKRQFLSSDERLVCPLVPITSFIYTYVEAKLRDWSISSLRKG